ncbi:hypothetical protein GS539_19335 [Rhodococcus hoagii]|nr:hypothetical protein [Prescottella equi]
MSTAEQIIAEHRTTMYVANGVEVFVCRCGKEFLPADSHAAHVVAALTNAGHMLLTPDDVERLGTVLVYTPIHDKTRVPLQVLGGRYDETVWAAARVAEGGDQP